VAAATTRGVSASLYYIFTYVFLVIGSFAVITVMARDGDTGHQVTDYRGLAKRQPLLAAAFVALLLGQAGAPFTTGFLAKFGVVGAAVDAHAYVMASVAMVSAAIAAFFYLRVAVTMYSPVGPIGSADEVGESVAGPEGSAPPPTTAGPMATEDVTAGDDPVTSLRVLTDAPPSEAVTDRGPVSVPPLTAVVIGVSVAFTIVFGIIPGPILDFAHHATLLFT
jgi:NADH-quinone oxidoreductase subunit N